MFDCKDEVLLFGFEGLGLAGEGYVNSTDVLS